MVLKQWGHCVITFLTFKLFIFSMFWIASCWKTNSFPVLLAESPVQISFGPRTAYETFALLSKVATAFVTGIFLSSNAPAQPTQ